MDGYQVRLTAKHARVARKLGDGRLGTGVRWAIEVAILASACPEVLAGLNAPPAPSEISKLFSDT